jgi:protein-L-isoaspartate(D-aspartate) O-methyltransferase
MAEIDFALQRGKMVDCQVRPNQVNDRRIINAMRELPRELFAPAASLAYGDADIALGDGRFMLAPMLTARLAQLVLANNPAHVLVVGAGAGYMACLLAAAGASVCAVEEEARLMKPEAVATYAPGVEYVSNRLALGWPAHGPYDAILIEGAVPEIPPHFASQLTAQGRLIAILADTSAAVGLGRAVIAVPAAGGFSAVPQFDCTARTLPAFQRAPAFTF